MIRKKGQGRAGQGKLEDEDEDGKKVVYTRGVSAVLLTHTHTHTHTLTHSHTHTHTHTHTHIHAHAHLYSSGPSENAFPATLTVTLRCFGFLFGPLGTLRGWRSLLAYLSCHDNKEGK